jgi:Fe-S cluster biogenesis protein NfuA
MSTETQKTPTSVYAEMTPNPATMKFVSNQLLIDGGHTAEYTTMAQTKGSSQLAEQLFNFPFVKGVFVASNFITITKTDAIQWDMVNLELRIMIKDWLEEGKAVVAKLPEQPESNEETAGRTDFANATPESAEDEQIIELLEEYVRPAVEADGGAINFKSYKDGVVTVVLRGACSGCPSSTITLKNGIESLLKQHLPGLKEVVAEEL